MVSVKNSLLMLKCCVCLLFQALNWNLNPLTVVSWLNIYMQVAYLNELYEVLLPQYPQQIFVQIAEVRPIPSFKYYFIWKKMLFCNRLIKHLSSCSSWISVCWILAAWNIHMVYLQLLLCTTSPHLSWCRKFQVHKSGIYGLPNVFTNMKS